MKILSRDFTRKEKAFLIVLALILVGLCYYKFVDQYVKTELAEAEQKAASLEVELSTVNAKVAVLTRMQNELDAIIASGDVTIMESYNNSKKEIAFLNDLLAPAETYKLTFANVTRDGDQIRRGVTVTFTTDEYDTAASILKKLDNCEYRCLINSISMTPRTYYYLYNGTISVTVNCTFFETMVGGTADAGLPAA